MNSRLKISVIPVMFIILFLGAIPSQMQGAYAGITNSFPGVVGSEDGNPQGPIQITTRNLDFKLWVLDADVSLVPGAGPWVKQYIVITNLQVQVPFGVDDNPINDPFPKGDGTGDQTIFPVTEVLTVSPSFVWVDWHEVINTSGFVWDTNPFIQVDSLTCGAQCSVSFPTPTELKIEFSPALVPGQVLEIQKTLVYVGPPPSDLLLFIEVAQFPGGIFSCGLGTTPNVITNECEPDVTQAQLDQALAAVPNALAQRDAILATLFEFLRVFGVI